MAKTSSNAWAWGYGINCRPGYNGASTVYPDNRLAYQNSPTQWFAPFQSLLVSNQSRRALLADGDNWQIDPSLAIQNSGAALSRHGTNRCNVVFFDGHVEAVTPDRLYKTLFDPASS
jgi:prepilin-type processing-associated H-X9-DG protein